MKSIKMYLKKLLKILKEELPHVIPIMVVPLVMGMVFSYVWSPVYIEHIPFGIVDLDNSSTSRNIVLQLKNHKGLDVNYYAKSESELEEAIKSKKINAGVIIPKNFSNDISMKKSPQVLILADGSNILVGGNAVSYAGTVISTVNAGAQMKMLQASGMSPSTAETTSIGTFTYVERVLYDPHGGYVVNMVYTLLLLLMQMPFVMYFFIPLMLKKKRIFASIKVRSKEFIYNIIDIFVRVVIVSLAGIIGNFGVLCLLKKLFSLPLRGDIFIYLIFMISFIFNIIAFSMVVVSIIKKMDYFAMMFLMLNTMFVFTGGVTYPFYMMPDNLRYFVKLLSPIAQVAVPLKALNLKGVGWNVMFPYLKESISYTVLWLPIGIGLYLVSVLIIKSRNKKSKLASEISQV